MTSKKPTCGVLAGEPVIIGERCADGGTCHHGCTAECFRRECCVPLTASGLNDDWSAPGEEPAPMLCPACEQPMVDGQAFDGLYGCHWACADVMRERERADRPPRKPTEAELLFEELRKTALEAVAIAEKLEAENYALHDQVKGLQELMAQQAEVEACYEHAQKAMEGETARLRAQLAEAQALLVKANYVVDHSRTIDKQAFSRGTQNVDHGLFRGLGNLLAQYDEALSASADPSAPAEQAKENCRGLGLDHRWAPGEITGHEFCTKCGEMRGADKMNQYEKLAYLMKFAENVGKARDA